MYAHPILCDQIFLFFVGGLLHLYQLISVLQVDGYQTCLPDVTVFVELCLLYDTRLRDHEQILVVIYLVDGYGRRDMLVRLQLQHIDYSYTSGIPGGFRYLICLQ